MEHKLRIWAVSCSNTRLNLNKLSLAWNHFQWKSKSGLRGWQWYLTGTEADPIVKGIHPECEVSKILLLHPRKISLLFVAHPTKKEKTDHMCSLCKRDVTLPSWGFVLQTPECPGQPIKYKAAEINSWVTCILTSYLLSLPHFLFLKYQSRK